jgi:hypothetical protein
VTMPPCKLHQGGVINICLDSAYTHTSHLLACIPEHPKLLLSIHTPSHTQTNSAVGASTSQYQHILCCAPAACGKHMYMYRST